MSKTKRKQESELSKKETVIWLIIIIAIIAALVWFGVADYILEKLWNEVTDIPFI